MTLRLSRHFTTRTVFWVCALVLFWAPALTMLGPAPAKFYSVHSQEQKGQEQKKQDEPLLRIETELVQIDVVVTDKQGKLVRDLKRLDFELFEDGKKQEITHFAVGTAAQPAKWLAVDKKKPAEKSAADSTPVEIQAGRYIVIAVDDFHIAPENLLNAKRTLHRFISNQMVAGDQVAIATTSGNIGMFQQFTNERDVLERAVNRLNVQNRTVTSSSDIPRITDYQAELIDIGDQDALELAVQEILRLEPMPSPPPQAAGRVGGSRGGFSAPSLDAASPRERAISQARSRARSIVAQNAHYTRATLSNLESVIRNLRNLTGRKMLILLSDGFHLGGNSSSQIFDLRRIIDAATRSGVVIYSIDARGLVAITPGGDASEPMGADDVTLPGVRGRIESSAVQAKLDGLNALASDTGGTLFKNSNDLNLGLQRVLDANETYYVLAYEPATPYRDGRFHKIEVSVAGRPDLKVRTRKGYFAPSNKTGGDLAENPSAKSDKRKEKSPEKIAQEAKLIKEREMREGLGSLVPLREIPIEMAVDFLDMSNAGPGALVNLHVDASQLNLRQLNGTHQTSLDLLAALFDEKGRAAASFVERINVNIRPERLENAVKHGFTYIRLMALKPGFYQARVAVREEGSSRMGSASKWVEVSDIGKKQLMLSGVLLSAGRDDLADLQLANNSYTPRPSLATRRFKRGGAIDFMVFAYNAKVEKNTADLVIQSQVFSGSKLVYASPISKMTVPEAADLQRIPYAARVSTEEFNPGPYELRLVVIDRLTKATAFRRVYFTVE
ncbi:MAG TPA: VWA domain-containing protein [Blastocatellia bacterium]|nr:VWA domain-containing protein [Blastocatellia bacterium]